MGYLSDYMENKILDHVLGTAAYSRPASIFLALCTADPEDDGTGSTIDEPSGGAYSRIACDGWTAATLRAITNDALVSYTLASADWGTITHFAILDTATLATGNVIAYGPMSPNKVIDSGDHAKVAIGDLDISCNSKGKSTYLANEILDHVFKGDAYVPPTSLFVALATATITDSDTGSTITEPGENYARIEVGTWDAAASGLSQNTSAFSLVTANGTGWGTVSDFCLCDHLSTGNMLYYGTLSTVSAIGGDDIAVFAIGAMSIYED